jgi:hypothetical protein
MARKTNKLNSKQQARIETVMMYARALNLHSIEAYQDWCIQQGLSTSLNKTKSQLECEFKYHKLTIAKSKLKQRKREGNMRHLVQTIYAREIKYQDINSEILKAINTGFRNAHNERLLRDVLLKLDECSKLLSQLNYVEGVISFVTHSSKWLRPIAEWQPNTHNIDRQFSSLARYLFAKYEIPTFMDSVWYNGDGKAKGWFVHVGLGNNIRTASSLPIKMTKKMSHYFMQAPANYHVKAAFRWAQIHALGGNKYIANAVVETRLSRVFNDDEFWVSVLRFFIANPMLDKSQYNPIIDFIWNQKYENQVVFIERGVAREEGPVQPNFSMHGRTPESLLRQVDNWHQQLGKETRGGQLQWVKTRLADYRYTEGRHNSKNMRVWSIRELLSSKELIAEGRKQQHCVATYARSCFSGGTSIWTMDVREILGSKKLLTIELHNSSKTIRQVRGLRNRKPTPQEMDIIHRWAHKEELSVASYI